MHTWLTVAALSKRLGRAPSTIRSWRDRYPAWVPERLDDAGHQTYPLERMEEIAVLAAKRLTPREIEAELAQRHGGDAEPAAGLDDLVLAELRAIRAAVERIADRLDPPSTEEGGCAETQAR